MHAVPAAHDNTQHKAHNTRAPQRAMYRTRVPYTSRVGHGLGDLLAPLASKAPEGNSGRGRAVRSRRPDGKPCHAAAPAPWRVPRPAWPGLLTQPSSCPRRGCCLWPGVRAGSAANTLLVSATNDIDVCLEMPEVRPALAGEGGGVARGGALTHLQPAIGTPSPHRELPEERPALAGSGGGAGAGQRA